MNNIWKIMSLAGLLLGFLLCDVNNAFSAQGAVMTAYKGVQLGMKQADVRAKLGNPANRTEDTDEYKLTGDDLMTVRYEGEVVSAIQLMFLEAKNAPPFSEVTGDAPVEQNESGRKIARKVMDAEKFWVTMTQSKDASMTNITIRKM